MVDIICLYKLLNISIGTVIKKSRNVEKCS